MRILITGATGLVGTHLTRLCREKGIEVNYLTTSRPKINKTPGYNGFYWDPEAAVIDEECLENVDAIIHLAGASVAKRWTSSYKKEIIESRTKSARLLHQTLQNSSHKITHFISASGIGVYPDSLQKLYTEEDKAIDDSFLGEVVEYWESSAWKFEDLSMDVAVIRIGMVLARESGALPKLKQPVSLNAGAAFGSGNQWQSWIHIEDLAEIFVFVLENKLKGIYNAVAPDPVTNKVLVEKLAGAMDKKVWLPNIPEVALKIGLGEMAMVVLTSQLVSSAKIQKAGYRFRYKKIAKALEDLV